MNEGNLKACFVILNYNTLDDTEKCINSILSMDCKQVKIIVVDNGSTDGSGRLLYEEYEGDAIVDIEIIGENLGFSKGNNYGYTIAKRFHPQFIIVCNSDIYFTQSNTMELIEKIYDEYKYSVLGPDIYIPDIEFHSNPISVLPIPVEKLKKIKQMKKIQLRWINFFCAKDWICEYLKKYRRMIKHVLGFARKPKPAQNNVLLQGACYILSEDFITAFDELFYPMDSFYYEEYFLFNKCKENKMLTRYDPELAVIHAGSSSTKKSFYNREKKKNFVLKNQIQSIEKYLQEYSDDYEKE